MDPRRSGRAHTLLSGGNLSGAQREELLGRVLAGVEGRAPAGWRRALAWAGASTVLAGAAVFLLLVRPAANDGLRAKGTPAPIVRVDCEPGGLEACRLGGTLLFAIEGVRPDARLAAWAEPAGGGERIWYFSGDGESPAIGDQTASILRRGIRVGPEHRPGAYRLTVLVTETPLPRAALLERAREGRGAVAIRTWPLAVVP